MESLRSDGVDALLVVVEPDGLGDFLTQRTFKTLPSKGIYGYRYMFAIAAFTFFLIDTASGEEMKGTRFLQVSAQRLGTYWRGAFANYGLVDQSILIGALRTRIINNIRVMLHLLKVIPDDDGTFEAYDPVRDKPGGNDYPQ